MIFCRQTLRNMTLESSLGAKKVLSDTGMFESYELKQSWVENELFEFLKNEDQKSEKRIKKVIFPYRLDFPKSEAQFVTS